MFFHALTFARSRGSCLNTRLLARVFKHLEAVSRMKLVEIIRSIHVFSCINICQVPRKLFEHEAVSPSVQTSRGC